MGGAEGAGWDRGTGWGRGCWTTWGSATTERNSSQPASSKSLFIWVGERVLGGTEGAGIPGAVLPQRETVDILPQVRVCLYGWQRGCWSGQSCWVGGQWVLGGTEGPGGTEGAGWDRGYWTIWGSATTEKNN